MNATTAAGFDRLVNDLLLSAAGVAAAVTLVTLVALAICRALAGRAVPVRHGVFYAAIGMVLLVLPASLAARACGWGVWRLSAAAAVSKPLEASFDDREASVAGDVRTSLDDGDSQPAPPHSADALAAPIRASAGWEMPWRTIGLAACIAWAGGVVLGGLLLIRDLAMLARFGRSLVPCRDPAAAELLMRAAQSLNLSHPPRLCESSAAVVPVVAGPLAPVVVLPRGLAERMPPGQLRAVLVHELAHVVRGDLWTVLLQRLAAILFWWCPPVHAVNRRLTDVRELLCDNHLLQAGGSAVDLAAALVDLAAAVPARGWRLAPGMLGALDDKPGVVGRVERLLRRDGCDTSTRLSRPARLAVVGFVLAALAVVAGTTIRAADRPGIDLAPLRAEEVAAIDAALEWLAAQQDDDGGWTLPQGRSAATGLAILPFLGRGHTHLEGRYKDRLAKGLRFLADRVTKGEGSVLQGKETMYSQGVVALTLCRAYGQTRDEALAAPAQAAIDFIAEAQDPKGGGWRYGPKQPGDTSVLGWIFPALATAKAAGLRLDAVTIDKVRDFLDGVAEKGGRTYGYVGPGTALTCSAIGLFVRSRTGWKPDDERLTSGAERVAKDPAADIYFAYHAAPLLHAIGGDEATAWQDRWRTRLLEAQNRDGDDKGSWLDGFAGTFLGNSRLMVTAFAAMVLETPLVHRTPVKEPSR
jgi:hypothetical protein